MLVIVDKTKYIYSMSPNSYKKNPANEVTKFYKIVPSFYVNSINEKSKEISNKSCIGNKIRTLCEKVTFVTVKDHEEDFCSCPSFRLRRVSGLSAESLSRISAIY